MKNKKIMIGIITIIIIIIVTILALTYILRQKNENDIQNLYNRVEEIEEIPVTIDNTIQREKNRNDYYSVQVCTQKLLSYSMDLFADNSLMDDEEAYEKQVVEMLYSMLDEEYIHFAQITQENLKQKITKIENSTINVTDIYVSQQTEYCSYYFVNGNLRNQKTNKMSDFKLMLKVDMSNKTFSIFLQDYLQAKGYNNLEIGKKLNLSTFDKVENKIYNIFEYQNISNNDYIQDIFSQYKGNLLYHVEEAYQYLDKEYAKKRFGNFEAYQTYVKNNYRKFVMMTLAKYQATNKGTYTQYICIDQNDNYYIFRETAPMQYTVILDTYTIDLPEFTEKYEKASEEEKVLMNIQKFFMALDTQDYRYAYSKLDETFKANNFKTQAEFETYVKSTFFASNKLAAGTAEKQNDIYLYKITITDKSGEKAESVSKTFVMQLKEGTDFVMSFSK